MYNYYLKNKNVYNAYNAIRQAETLLMSAFHNGQLRVMKASARTHTHMHARARTHTHTHIRARTLERAARKHDGAADENKMPH